MEHVVGATMFCKNRFELADNGTIFLDEMGDLPPAIQTKLPLVLQARVFERKKICTFSKLYVACSDFLSTLGTYHLYHQKSLLLTGSKYFKAPPFMMRGASSISLFS